MLTTLLAKLLTAKIAAAAAVLAVAAGGVATAAATGYLPTPLGGNPTTAPTHSVTSTTSATPSSADAGDSDDHGAALSPGSPPPPPSLTGLCNAYTAGAGSAHGKALDSPPFRALITAAGGKDKVDAYCADLLASQRGKASVTATPPASSDVDHGGQGHGPPPGHSKGSPTTHPSH